MHTHPFKTSCNQKNKWTEENMGKLIVKNLTWSNFILSVNQNVSAPYHQIRKSSNWRPLLKFYSPKCFSTRHGNRNGRSLERWKKSRKQAKEAHTVRAYPGFCSMKQLRVLLFPPGWDASLLQGYLPPAVCCQYPFYTPGWRETMWGKVSCLRKQHDGRDWVSNHQPSDLKSNALTTTQPRPLVLIILKLWNQNLHLQGHLQDFPNKNLLKLAGKKALPYFSDHVLAFWWVLAIFLFNYSDMLACMSTITFYMYGHF